MPQATLSVTLSTGTPLRDVSSRFEVDLYVVGASLFSEPPAVLVSCCTGDGDGDGDDAGETATSLRDHAATDTAAILRKSATEALVHCRMPTPTVTAVAKAGVAFRPPLIVSGGEGELTVQTTDEGLSALRRRLEESPVGFDVQSVHATLETPDLLSERQERVLEAAVENGFYDIPREATVEAIADDLGLAISTVSETLARAERRLVTSYLRNHGRLTG